jgi:hypothetical protein
MLKNASYVPKDVDLLREIKTLKEKLSVCSDRVEREHLNREINDRTLKLNLLQEQKEQAKRKAPEVG